MSDTGSTGEPNQPDAFARMQTLSEDKRRLLEAMMRQRAAEGAAASPAPRPDAQPQPWPGVLPRADSHARPDAQPRLDAQPRVDAPPQPQPSGRLNADPAPDPMASLVAIKVSGSLPPFFCVHGIMGSAFPYFRLALHLDPEQPFYGLQSPGLDGTVPPLETIEEMARHYVTLIQGVQPHGPYSIGGYSFGGWVAFEMAQQLVAAGETVDILIMLGTGAPLSTSNPRLFEQINFMARYSDDYNRLVLNSFLPDAARTAVPPPGPQVAPPPGLSPVAAVAAANNVAQFRYMPRPYGGRIILFITGEQHAAAFPETTLGWKMLSIKDVPVHLVSGNHLNMFEDPHVRDVGEKLSACLRPSRKEWSTR